MSRVLLVDDHPLVCLMLQSVIEEEPGIEVCGEASTFKEGMSAITSFEPDVAVVDITLEGGSGLELIRRVQAKSPGIKFVVFSAHDESDFAQRAIEVGAMGYVSKREVPYRVVDAIRTVLNNELYFSQAVLAKKQLNDERGLASLSNREIGVLELIGQGNGNTSIANQLNLSVKTIESHRENIKKKLGLKSASELSRYSMQWLLNGG